MKKTLVQCLIVPLLSLMLAAGLSTAPANAIGVYDLPVLGAGQDVWVVDEADVISRTNEGALSDKLRNLAEDTGHEVRMVIFRRLDYGETIDSFVDGLFSTWYPIPELQTNQTILALDTLTNNSAFRTGESKELITDAFLKSMVEETIGIVLQNGNKYNQALLDSADRLRTVLSGQPDPGPQVARETINAESTYTSAEDTKTVSSTVWVVIVLIVATVVPMVTYFWYVGFPGS